MNRLHAICIAVLFCLFVGCASSGKSVGKFDGNYKLIKLQDVSLTDENSFATIQIREGSIYGKAVVNQWTALIRDNRIGNLVYSKRPSNTEVQQLEARLLAVFQNSEVTRGMGGSLLIKRNGETLARFKKVSK
ncbi:MAG: hypothetical protein ACPGES_10140 [Coraliomargarita sp.]